MTLTRPSGTLSQRERAKLNYRDGDPAKPSIFVPNFTGFPKFLQIIPCIAYNIGRAIPHLGSFLPPGVRTMATAAQIEANRRNAQMSTGPKTQAGKAKASLNCPEARRAGQDRRAGAAPGGPRGSWTRRSAGGSRTCSPGTTPSATWSRGRPGSPGCSTALERCETAGLAVRVRQAQLPSNVETVEQVCDLGRKLLYNAGPRILPVSGPPWDDNPAAFLCGLESTAEGCRWLLERWTVLGDMLERGAIWTLTDLYRSIRLQGKHPVDAVNDPDLNLQIQAWEMMSPGAAVDFWERCYHQTPTRRPGVPGVHGVARDRRQAGG